jgi:hypothetical protein
LARIDCWSGTSDTFYVCPKLVGTSHLGWRYRRFTVPQKVDEHTYGLAWRSDVVDCRSTDITTGNGWNMHLGVSASMTCIFSP